MRVSGSQSPVFAVLLVVRVETRASRSQSPALAVLLVVRVGTKASGSQSPTLAAAGMGVVQKLVVRVGIRASRSQSHALALGMGRAFGLCENLGKSLRKWDVHAKFIFRPYRV